MEGPPSLTDSPELDPEPQRSLGWSTTAMELENFPFGPLQLHGEPLVMMLLVGNRCMAKDFHHEHARPRV
jgi:hypothetical protein